MQGTRRIVLVEPGPSGERDPSGQPLDDEHQVSHVVWAVREPGGSGTEGIIAGGVLGVEAKRVYRFAADTLPRSRPDPREGGRPPIPIVVDEDWKVIDENGVTLDIEAVMEVTPGARRRWLKIVCERTDTRRAV